MKEKKDIEKLKEEAKDAEKRSAFEASIRWKEVLHEANKQNDSELISEAKDKMIEQNHLSKNEYREISVEKQIPTRMVEEAMRGIIGDSKKLSDILKRIGHHPHLQPNKKETEESARKNISVFSQIASTHRVSSDNHALGGDEYEYHSYLESYGIHQSLITKMMIGRIFDELKNKYNLTFDELKSYLEKSGVFGAEDLFFIESGLEYYFKGEYTAAIHILIPRFERCFVILSKALGIQTTSLKRTKKGNEDVITSDITLSVDLLRKKEFTDAWGEDLCENIIYVFYERLGYGLRHKIAHGTLSFGESNQLICELIIYFYIVLASRIRMIDKD